MTLAIDIRSGFSMPARRPRAAVAAAPMPAARPAAPVRLTTRGMTVLAGLATALVLALLWLASPSGDPAPVAPVPSVVTVHSGDTLWTIAERVAPGSDPRAVVDRLIELNGLASASLAPGQSLRTR